jgi:hypothetical protein
MKVAYVAGPYRAPTETGLFRNILSARQVAIRLWQAGYSVVCPHSNTAFMGGEVPDETFLAGDLAILERCDLVVMLPGWEHSTGARGEKEHAEMRGIPVYIWPEVPSV